MRLTCSACGAHGSVEQFTADTAAREAFALALSLPGGMGGVALRYIGLFRPHKRGLTWDRSLTLLREVSALVAAGQVERHGKPYAASAALFASAMQRILDQRASLQLPLTSHGYLVAIIAGDSPREAARIETEQEQHKQQGSRARSSLPAGPSLLERQNRQRLEQQAREGDAKAQALLASLDKKVDA